MLAHIVFAEEANLNEDGTFDLVRGGLASFDATGGVAWVKGDLLVTIQHDFSDAGEHELRLKTIDEDGEEILGGVEGSFVTPPHSGFFHLAIRLKGELPVGSYEVLAAIDDHIVAVLPFAVDHAQRLPKAG